MKDFNILIRLKNSLILIFYANPLLLLNVFIFIVILFTKINISHCVSDIVDVVDNNDKSLDNSFSDNNNKLSKGSIIIFVIFVVGFSLFYFYPAVAGVGAAVLGLKGKDSKEVGVQVGTSGHSKDRVDNIMVLRFCKKARDGTTIYQDEPMEKRIGNAPLSKIKFGKGTGMKSDAVMLEESLPLEKENLITTERIRASGAADVTELLSDFNLDINI